MRRERAPIWIAVLAAIGAAFFVLPLVGLVLRAPWGDALRSLTSPDTLEALKLSLIASLSSTAVSLLLGVPLAWVYARIEFPGRTVLRALTTLPMVLPPVVGGIALLLAFGRRGLLGSWLATTFGITLPFTTAGVVFAETFVAMPFLVLTVEAGLRSMDRRYEDAARTLGARRWTVFTRVTLPLIAPRNVCEDPDVANVRKTSNPACWYRIGVAPNHSSLESPSTAHGPPESFPNAHRVYCSFAHSALACLRMGMSGSASFQSVRKSWYAARALVVSLCIA